MNIPVGPYDHLVDRLQGDQLAIYLFHGVVDDETFRVRNYTDKHLRADRFEDFIVKLTKAGAAISLDEVLEHRVQGKELPPKSFAITFDDGFENNLTVAAPILEKHDVPATFYVATDFIESNRMSWIDRIEAVIEQRDVVEVSLPWRTATLRASTTAEQIALLDEIRKQVKNDGSIEPDVLATEIQRQCGFDEIWSGTNALDQKLTWEQVRELNDHPLFCVGGHTHTHAIMSHLSSAELDEEIDTSLSLLAEKAGVGPAHYSYPEGLAHCYSDAVIEALKKRGVQCCPTAEDGTNTTGESLFHLKRIFVV